MNIPKQYIAGLSVVQRKKQIAEIKKSRKEYEETGEVEDRPKVSSEPTKRSVHVKRFEKKYGFPITDLDKVKRLFPDTDIEGILSKGTAAYASGSRPNVSVYQWKMARLASVLTGGKAFNIDKDLVGPKSKTVISSH